MPSKPLNSLYKNIATHLAWIPLLNGKECSEVNRRGHRLVVSFWLRQITKDSVALCRGDTCCSIPAVFHFPCLNSCHLKSKLVTASPSAPVCLQGFSCSLPIRSVLFLPPLPATVWRGEDLTCHSKHPLYLLNFALFQLHQGTQLISLLSDLFSINKMKEITL